MQCLKIPGTHELSDTPVTPTTQEGSTRLTENSDKADTDDEYSPADAPSLMREISEALSRPEVGIFKADESESDEDHEGQSDNENNENETNPKNEDSEDSPQALEDEASDTDSTTTVEFTASESAERENRSEEKEIIDISTEDDEVDDDVTQITTDGRELDTDNTGKVVVQDHHRGQENSKPNNLVIYEDHTPAECVEGDKGDDQDTDQRRGRSMRRSTRRTKSPSHTPKRSRRSSGGRRKVSTASPTLRVNVKNSSKGTKVDTTEQKNDTRNTPAGKSRNREVATNSSLVLTTAS